MKFRVKIEEYSDRPNWVAYEDESSLHLTLVEHWAERYTDQEACALKNRLWRVWNLYSSLEPIRADQADITLSPRHTSQRIKK